MANIKNLQMWNRICTNNHISINKSLFGLCTTAVFKPTGSIIDARIVEFSADDGRQLSQIFNSSYEDLAQAIGNFRPKPISNGNYLAEVCTSRDGIFLAVLLKKFVQLNYEPVTDVLIFEGNDANIVSKMF